MTDLEQKIKDRIYELEKEDWNNPQTKDFIIAFHMKRIAIDELRKLLE